MARFFIDGPVTDSYLITGENAQHISRSLRMREGEEVVLCDGKGTDYRCTLTGFTSDTVTAKLLETKKNTAEPPCPIVLYQAFPKADKFELVIQKATELGVTRIVPVLTSRCIARPDEKKADKKLERFNKIALEAAKQSGRGVLPQVTEILSFRDAVREMASFDSPLFFYEKGGMGIKKAVKKETKSVAVMVGSEGGFSEAEAEEAQKAGLLVCTLGPRILRTETAPLAALAVITNLLEEEA